MWKALAAALLGLSSLGAAPVPFDMGAIVMLRCGRSTGTAFHVGAHRLATAAHVTARGPCSIEGVRVTVATEQVSRDFSILHSPAPSRHVLRFSCRGMRVDDRIQAVGFAAGESPAHVWILKARANVNDDPNDGAGLGMRHLDGQTYPGMSGGPMIVRGEVVGIVSRGSMPGHPAPPRSISRELRHTALCGDDR